MIERHHAGPDLIRALRASDLPEVNRLLRVPVSVNMLDIRGVSALMVAAYRGFAAECQLMIDGGADVLYSIGKHYGEGADEYTSVELRAAMSKDAATIKVVGTAAAKARFRLYQADSTDFDPWQLLEDCARWGLASQCAVLLDEGHLSMIGGGALAERVLSAAYESRDWRTYHVIVAMGVDTCDLILGQLVSTDFIDAVATADAHAKVTWAEDDRLNARRVERQLKGDAAPS